MFGSWSSKTNWKLRAQLVSESLHTHKKVFTIFREKATSVSLGWFSYSASIAEEEKKENLEKNPQSENQQWTQPRYKTRPKSDPGHIYLERGEHSHNFPIPAPQTRSTIWSVDHKKSLEVIRSLGTSFVPEKAD